MGVLDTVEMFAAVVIAGPLALLGVDFVLSGRRLEGAVFLALAVGGVLAVRYKPDLGLAGRVTGAAADAVLPDAGGDRGEGAGREAAAAGEGQVGTNGEPTRDEPEAEVVIPDAEAKRAVDEHGTGADEEGAVGTGGTNATDADEDGDI